MKIDSLVVQGLPAKENENGAIIPPIYLASTYIQPSLSSFQEFAYARGNNPTRKNIETLICRLEGVDYGFAFSSGMAATATILNLFSSGDKIIFNNNIYGGTYRYLDQIFRQQGLNYDLIDDLNQLTMADLTPDVKGIFIETPSNPLLRITDIQRISELAHQKGILVIVDNTFATPYFQRPFEYGADIVVYSATKYLSGHADVIAGLVTVAESKLAERIQLLQNTLGNILSPTDSYSLIRGIKTLSVRLDRQEANAKQIIAYLTTHQAIKELYFPGSASAYEAQVQLQQTSGNGSVFSLELVPEANIETFVSSLEIFDLAVSLGGVESLICHPRLMTHESYDLNLQKKVGITQGLLWIAIGVENVEDLINDLDQALQMALSN